MTSKKIFILTFIISLVVGLVSVKLYFDNKETEPIVTEPIAVEPTCVFGEMVAEYNMCGKEIGRSVENRPIYVFKIGDGEENLLFVGGLHTGQEMNTYDLAKEVMAHYAADSSLVPNTVSLYIIPMLNPDGAANDTHTNANGVNLNRNWGSSNWQADVYHPTAGTTEGGGGAEPYSEPETRALYEYILEIKPKLATVWHSKAGTVEDSDVSNADVLGELYANAAGYEHIDEWTYYEVTGDFIAAMEEEGVPAMEVELETRETELERNRAGMEAVFETFSYPGVGVTFSEEETF